MFKDAVRFVLIMFVLFTFQSAWGWANDVPVCRLGVNPVDTEKDMDWNNRCLLTLTQNQVVRMSSKSGTISECKMQIGTSVVIDKETGEALYVRYCTNELPDHPILIGQRDCAPPPKEVVTLPPSAPTPTPTPETKKPQAPQVTLTILQKGEEVSEVKKGSEVVLVWESTNADRCDALTGPGFNTRGHPNGRFKTVLRDKGLQTFNVQCQGEGGYVVEEATVTVKSNAWRWIVGAIVVGVAAAVAGGGGGGSDRPPKQPN